MAVSDIFSACFELQMPGGPASLNMHFQETTPPSSQDETDALAGGLVGPVVAALRAVLASDCKFTQLNVYKKGPDKVPPATKTLPVGTGLSGGASLPAQFGAKLALGQSFFESVSNGMIWIPGLDEERVSVSLIDPTYLNVEILAFADALLTDIVEPAAGDGRYRLVVLSRKFLDLNPGDYAGASAVVESISRLPLIGRQKRRRTKIRGGAS